LGSLTFASPRRAKPLHPPEAIAFSSSISADLCVIARTETTEAGFFWNRFYAGEPISGIRPFTNLKVGERVFAIGNPSPGKEGPLTWSLTEGIVSALRRDESIQMSAAIYHGNSGGGLFDRCQSRIMKSVFRLAARRTALSAKIA
jgi:hypothetical protein